MGGGGRYVLGVAIEVAFRAALSVATFGIGLRFQFSNPRFSSYEGIFIGDIINHDGSLGSPIRKMGKISR